MTQLSIILDNPPNETDPWATEVFKKAGFFAVSNDAVGDAMAKDETARKALLEGRNPVLEAEAMAPHYKAALDRLHGAQPRLGLYGTAWLVYQQPIAACVVDWSGIEKLSTTTQQGVEKVPYEHFKRTSHEFIDARVKKYVAAERYLALQPGLSVAQKVEQTLAFLKGLGLVK